MIVIIIFIILKCKTITPKIFIVIFYEYKTTKNRNEIIDGKNNNDNSFSKRMFSVICHKNSTVFTSVKILL